MPTADVVVIGGGVIGLSTAYHFARKRAGRIVLLEKGLLGDGSSSRAAGITCGELSTPTTVRDDAAERLAELVPALKNTEWKSEHVGLLGYSMDHEPIMGPVDRWPGLFVGASFHSGGFSYNPVAGLLLAECVVDGQTSIDISAFSPHRFQDADIEAHLAKTFRQSDVEGRRH